MGLFHVTKRGLQAAMGGPVSVKLEVSSVGAGLYVKGEIRSIVHVLCDCCSGRLEYPAAACFEVCPIGMFLRAVVVLLQGRARLALLAVAGASLCYQSPLVIPSHRFDCMTQFASVVPFKRLHNYIVLFAISVA